jgi:hypothetical protein
MNEDLVITYPPPESLNDADFERMMLSRAAYTAMRDARVEREKVAPRIGEAAPDFTLERLSATGKRSAETFQLSQARGRPVALIFGSYT